MIDTATGGIINRKIEEEALNLIDEMVSNSYQWQIDQMMLRRPAVMHGADSIPTLSPEIVALRTKFNNIKGAAMHVQSITCQLCEGGHNTSDCQAGNPFAKASDTANYLEIFFRLQQNNPYSNTYNLGWRDHPNLSYGGGNRQ